MNCIKYTIFFLLIIVTCQIQTSFGQSVKSTKSRFEVNYTKGCNGLNVTVTETDNFEPNVTRVYDYEYQGDPGSINPVDTLQWVYSQPGDYTIIQIIGIDGPEPDFKFDTLQVKVMEVLPPEFEIYTCETNGVLVQITDDYYDRFEVDFGDGSAPEIVPAGEITHYYTVQNTYPVSIEGIFDNADTNCGVTTQNIVTIENLEQASITQVAVLDESQIEVGYGSLKPGVIYQLEIAENGSDNYSFYSFVSRSVNGVVVDGLDTRNGFYCFRVTAYNACDESKNLPSELVCSIALDVTAENLQNNLTWLTDVDAVAGYAITKNGNVLAPITNPAQTNFTDQPVVCQVDYTYQVSGVTAFGAVSTSEPITVTGISTEISPPLSNVTIAVKGQALLVSFADADSGLFFIERSEAGSSFMTIDTVTENSYVDNTVFTNTEYCYRISYADACGNYSESSNPVCLEVPTKGVIYFPTAFTPNSDGLNDIFSGKSDLINSVTWQVYNRWGELLFYSESLDQGWDGYFGGKLVPEGSYLYKAEFVDHLGANRSQSGSFLLIYKTLK